MLCVHPYKTGQEEFGCGKCLPCRFARRRITVGRILLESLCHRHSCFVTLTYKEDPGGFRKEDIQVFVRALRKRKLPVRYFAVGERGAERSRPHFHVALFGVSFEHRGEIQLCWKHGFVDVGELNSKSAHYIAKYVCKGGEHLVLRSLKPGIGGHADERIAKGLRLVPVEVEDVPPSMRFAGRVVPLGRYIRSRVRKLIGRSPLTPQSVRLRQVAEYAEMDAELRERKRANAYESAVVRLAFIKSKERLK